MAYSLLITIGVMSQCTYRCVVLPDEMRQLVETVERASQCTYRCVVLPDFAVISALFITLVVSQCTYRCVVLPDSASGPTLSWCRSCLNAPTGAWCSLTRSPSLTLAARWRLNAPTGAWCSLTPFLPSSSRCTWSQCTYRCVVLPDSRRRPCRWPSACLNAPTGAWCSLTPASESGGMTPLRGPGAPPAPGAPLRTGQHRAQTST